MSVRIVSQVLARMAKHARRRQLAERDRFNKQTREAALKALRNHFQQEEDEARHYLMLLETRRCLAYLDSELRRIGAHHG